MKNFRPASGLVLLVACAASAVAAWLNFRASDNVSAIRFGRGTVSFDPHYPDIRLAWLVALVAAAVAVVLTVMTRPSRWRMLGALLIVAAVVPVVVSLIISPAHFVLGTPHPVDMDPHRFDVAAWLCVASAGAFLVLTLGAIRPARAL